MHAPSSSTVDEQNTSNDGDEVPPSHRELDAKLESFRAGLESAWDEIDALREELREEREARRRLEDENDELRDRLDDLDARTDLLRLANHADDLTGKQRSAALIQHLRRAAEKERDRGRDAKASVNREEADSALKFPDVERTTIYKDMRRAERIVGNENVLWYESKSGGESRLKLNLEAGDLPRDAIREHGNHEEMNL